MRTWQGSVFRSRPLSAVPVPGLSILVAPAPGPASAPATAKNLKLKNLFKKKFSLEKLKISILGN